MKATTVKAIKAYAEREGLTMEELAEKYQIVSMAWDQDGAEVLVPNSMPVEGQRVPVAYVII